MRLFCTCDCRATEKGLENALAAIDTLKRQYAELDGLYHRLQGRYARAFRPDEPDESADVGRSDDEQQRQRELDAAIRRKDYVTVRRLSRRAV